MKTAFVGLLALCAAHGAAARDLQQVLNTGTLRVGIVLYAPWAVRAANGELAGFEVDVARQLAADMGVKADVLPYEFSKLIPALESGEIDIIAAGLAITPSAHCTSTSANPTPRAAFRSRPNCNARRR